MPLSVNVGLSQKASKDYQSTGYSINVTAELDQSLLARPEELQLQIDALYQQAEIALSKQAGEPQQPSQQSQQRQQRFQQQRQGNRNGYPNAGGQHTNRYANRAHRENGNGGGNGYSNAPARTNGRNGNGRGNGAVMTESQRKAIFAIAARIQADANTESRDFIGAELDELSISQASELIDHLKALQASHGPNGSNGTNGSNGGTNGGGR